MNTLTIAAIATAPGSGAVSVLRISGPEALSVVERVFRPRRPGPWTPRQLRLGQAHDPETGRLIDEVMAAWFPGPNSFTGEDLCEIQGHGGQAVTALVLRALLSAGAALAEPGEFTRRAFLNGRMDLTQAEAVADLIAAQSAAEASLAARQLAGGLSERVAPIHKAIESALVNLSADIDFSDDMEPLDLQSFSEKLNEEALKPLRKLLADAKAGRPYREGLKLALIGAPNVGKSSLFNALAGSERALVSPLAGTTRDFITTSAILNDLRVELCDTAGLSETPADELDSLGQKRSRSQLAAADVILWVRDLTAPSEEAGGIKASDLPAGRSIVVWNKTDLAENAAPATCEGDWPAYMVSARSGQGLTELKKGIIRLVTGSEEAAPPEIAPNLRHQSALNKTAEYLTATIAAVKEGQPPDICAFELKAALDSLSLICGRTTADDILNEIFARFCLGK